MSASHMSHNQPQLPIYCNYVSCVNLHPPHRQTRRFCSSTLVFKLFLFVFFIQETTDLQMMKDEIGDKLITKHINLLDDIYDYLSCKDKSQWSLGKDHIQMIHTVIGDGRMGEEVRVGVYKLLQALVLLDDFITLLQHEPTELIMNIVQHYDQLTEQVHTAILKLVR